MRITACNSGLAKVAVQYSADTFVVNQTLVLRINICGKNRHLRQAAKRYVQLYWDSADIKLTVFEQAFCRQLETTTDTALNGQPTLRDLIFFPTHKKF